MLVIDVHSIVSGDVGRSKEAVPVVAFIACLQKMLSVESNRSETIVFEQVDINEGSGYSPSTGVFTAAHRGVYKFSMTIMAQMDSIVSAAPCDRPLMMFLSRLAR